MGRAVFVPPEGPLPFLSRGTSSRSISHSLSAFAPSGTTWSLLRGSGTFGIVTEVMRSVGTDLSCVPRS